MSASHHHGLHLTVRSLLEFLIVAIFIATFIVQPFRVPSQSMEPTLHLGDFVFADKQSFSHEGPLRFVLPQTEVHRGDLAVFHFPPEPQTFLVKRIVGMPGDRLRMKLGITFVNGTPLAEPYAYLPPARLDPFRDNFPFLRELDPNVDPAWWRTLRSNVRDGEITVPADSYFVLGDNRDASEDSRYWGFVPRTALAGKPLLVYLSLPDDGRHHTLRERVLAAWHGFRILR